MTHLKFDHRFDFGGDGGNSDDAPADRALLLGIRDADDDHHSSEVDPAGGPDDGEGGDPDGGDSSAGGGSKRR